ncbi:hypothetical protein [Ruminococcus flavefaciens]|nr:hypothetical protein [Ruminococcus flavefaciens]
MEYLVVDMRNNVGGCGPIGYELCSLLSDKDIYAMGAGSSQKTAAISA